MSEVEKANPVPPNPEQVQFIRQQLLLKLQQDYTRFIDTFKNLPLPAKPIDNAIIFLDSGYLWLEKAIQAMLISVQQAAPEAQAPAEGIAVGEYNPAAPHDNPQHDPA